MRVVRRRRYHLSAISEHTIVRSATGAVTWMSASPLGPERRVTLTAPMNALSLTPTTPAPRPVATGSVS